jgi:hypothetical protein
MLARFCFSLALLVTMPAWSQVEPSATSTDPTSGEPMRKPPPVSGDAYPSATASETRSNELRVGLSFQAAYDDNILAGETPTAISDESYSMKPTMQIDQRTSRFQQSLVFEPGFTFYQHTSARNEADQLVRESIEYWFSPHTTVTLRDSFLKSTNVLNQPYGDVSGSAQPSAAQVMAPFADTMSNAASGEATYQFGLNGMIGGSGTTTLLNYLNPSQAVGLSNSETRGGSAFYNLRLPRSQYVGVTYQYSRMIASIASSQSATYVQTANFYYTLYLVHSLTLSVSGGPQHFSVTEPPLPPSASWTPAVEASMGWQRMRTNLAASYSRSVSGAGGMLGAFQSDSARASVRFRCARTWIVAAAGDYWLQKAALPAFIMPSSGGHGVSGTSTVQHTMGEHITAEFGYTRVHQSYASVAAVSANPDSDRGYVSISYQFTKPLGR